MARKKRATPRKTRRKKTNDDRIERHLGGLLVTLLLLVGLFNLGLIGGLVFGFFKIIGEIVRFSS